jgi:hypothetical protein
MRLSMQSNSRTQPSKVSTSIKQQPAHRQSSEQSYAEEVLIREEKIQNSARTSQNIIRSQANGANYPERNSLNNSKPNERSFLPNGDDDDDDDGEDRRSIGSLDDSQANYTDYGDDRDYREGSEEDDLTGKDLEPPSYSNSSSTRHSTAFSSAQPIDTSDDRQSYDPKRYHSLGSTTEINQSQDRIRSTAQPSLDTTTELTRKIPPLDHGLTTQSSSSPNVKTPNKSDLGMSKSNQFNSSGKDRIVEISPDGVKITKYSNGTVKYQFPDGASEVHFTNGDKKTQNPNDSTLVYFYAQAKTTHTTYADGTEVYSFPTGQVCIRMLSSPLPLPFLPHPRRRNTFLTVKKWLHSLIEQ